MMPETIETKEFGVIHWEDGYYTGSVAHAAAESNVSIDIESEIMDVTIQDMQDLVEFSQQTFKLFSKEMETNIRKEVAIEVLESCCHQQREKPTENNIMELFNDMKLSNLSFSEDCMQVVWQSAKFFQNQSITIQLDGDLETEEIMVQE